MATQQDDIKRVLAYSTISQLGYMVMAVGLASGQAAMFHLFTHAAFKALLFLGSGSIIFMLHHEQNIWRMGGLAKRLPITFLTFLVGTLALIGFPGFSGFFSKDAILALAYEKNFPIFLLGIFTALLTAFYMTRLVVVTFFGTPRTKTAAQGGESPAVMTVPLVLLAIPAAIGGFSFFAHRFLVLPNEKEASLAVPIIAFLVLLMGALSAIYLYRDRTREPLQIALFRERFYLDEIYQWFIGWTQEMLAAIAGFLDRWILDGAIVRGLSGGSWAGGFLLRLLQVGNLQGYAFLFGLGIIGLIYFALFR
jgi:NADH-quinone oxidoreductase subunit L